MSKRLLILLLASCCALPLSAQTTDTPAYVEEPPFEGVYAPDEEEEEAERKQVVFSTATPSEGQWAQQVRRKEFVYKDQQEFIPPKEPKKEEKTAPYQTPWYIRVLEGLFRFLASPAGTILLWMVLGLLIAYIIYQVVAGNGRLFARRNKKMTAEEPQELSQEDLLGSNWEERLRRATESGNVRLSVRYSYLLLLQLLQQRELIAFRTDKTNTDYYRELGDTGPDLRPSFRQLSRQYEYAWYGNFLPGKEAFAAYMHEFNGVKSRLQGS